MTVTPSVPGTINVPSLTGNEVVRIDKGSGAGQTTTQAIANLGGGGSALTITDGTHTVADTAQITVAGGTVGGTTPDATLTFPPVRTILTADTTFYVATTGNDTTGDGTVGNPWATPQHANDVIFNSYDLNFFQPKVQLVDSVTPYPGFLITPPIVGASPFKTIIFTGNASDYTKVKIAENPNFRGTCVGCISSCVAIPVIENVNIVGPLTTDQFYVFTSYPGSIQVGNFDGGTVGFSNSVDGDCFNVGGEQGGGVMIVVDNIIIDGTSSSQWDVLCYASNTGLLFFCAAVTFINSPIFTSAVAAADTQGYLNTYFEAVATFTGSLANGVKKFVINTNGIIDTGGVDVNFFPGSVAGTFGGLTGSFYGCYVPPNSDPHISGAFWNNAGTPTISAG